MIKVDLHTHSTASYDGGLSAEQYRRVLETKLLDCIAITDHNRIDFALELQKQLGKQIIVGQEIMTSSGEIIGLFLKKSILAGLTPEETIKQVKAQGGLVYVPHPLETVRKGLSQNELDKLAAHIDIVEVANGRAFFQNRGQKALLWARLNHKVVAASSDAHGIKGLGSTYMAVAQIPTAHNLLKLLQTANLTTKRPVVLALLYPKYHRLRKKFVRGHV